jgi:hypothetical protein
MRKLYHHLLKLINESQVLGFPIFPIKSTRLGKQQADDLKKIKNQKIPANNLQNSKKG